MTIPLTTNEPVFQSAHRLTPTEWEFVDRNCEKLVALGMIRKSTQTSDCTHQLQWWCAKRMKKAITPISDNAVTIVL